MRTLSAAVISVAACTAALFAQTAPHEQRARDIYKELVEINTTDTPAGSVTKAAEAMAARLQAAGFPDADIQLLGPAPNKFNLVARYRGTGAKRPMLLLAHLDVVDAKREDWSFDPFVFREEDGWFYGRGTSDDKAMASQFVANLIRLKEEGFKPDRDLILALTADEEGGDFNGAYWLVKKHRDLVDAEFAINEGGGGNMRKGKYLTNEIQASEKVYQDFQPRGDQLRRPQLATGEGQRHLPPRAGPCTPGGTGIPGPAQRNHAHLLRTLGDGRSRSCIAADMRAVARPTPDLAAAARLSAKLPYWNSMMRTTCVATRLAGGHANNALPQLATANVNCRILPGATIDAVKTDDHRYARRSEDYGRRSSRRRTRASRSTLRPDVLNAVESLTKEMFPGVVVVPVMSTGATDGLYFRNAGIPTYGVDGTFGDIDDVRAHGRDERVGVKQYFEGLEFQYRLIKALSK